LAGDVDERDRQISFFYVDERFRFRS